MELFEVNLKQPARFSAVPWGTMAISGYIAGTASDYLIQSGYSTTTTRKIMQDIAPQCSGFLHGISGTLAAIISTVGTGFFVQWLGSFQVFLTLTACLYFITAIFWNLYATGEKSFLDRYASSFTRFKK